MTHTHEHSCGFCKAYYYCVKPHARAYGEDDGQQHNKQHVRTGYRCCPPCRDRNIMACIKPKAYTVMP